MDLINLKSVFASGGCERIFLKDLSENDNSKNQVYFGGSFDILNMLPVSEIRNEEAGDWKRERFKAQLQFYWIGEDGKSYLAPHAQLVLYPKYPEVRFSGFLSGCTNAPSELMATRLAGRVLFLGVDRDGKVLGYVTPPDSGLSREVKSLHIEAGRGVFKVIELKYGGDNRQQLLDELKRIHGEGWIKSKRLSSNGDLLDCSAPNCGGYTLEAELGITPNGFAEPDYLGWEIKQFQVQNFQNLKGSIITLMTPEPTIGYYANEGVEAFVRKYGYPDTLGRPDRINFGGIYKFGDLNERTHLRLDLIGFDVDEGKIRNTNGRIALIDRDDNEAASWPFSTMLKHWNRKHSQACYIPSQCLHESQRKYKFGSTVILGTGTDFIIFLKSMARGLIYYDPGIKLENASTASKVKRRSQFRIKSGNLHGIYRQCEEVNLESGKINTDFDS